MPKLSEKQRRVLTEMARGAVVRGYSTPTRPRYYTMTFYGDHVKFGLSEGVTPTIRALERRGLVDVLATYEPASGRASAYCAYHVKLTDAGRASIKEAPCEETSE